MRTRILILLVLFWLNLARATGLVWPDGQLLPSFSAPAPVVDCIDVSSSSGAEIDLFASLEGIVNRTQPQIICVTSASGEGAYTWLNLHNQAYIVTNGYNVILQFRTNVVGLVVTDTNLADTLNLATTMAGVNNELICNPSLLGTLTNAPYNLPIVDDLRGRFANRYAAYGWLYTNYWPLCTHRIMAGLETNLDGNLRDYLVAAKVATVWLDPGASQDATLLGKFVSNMTAGNGVYIGWWPSEGNGLTWIASYGIPVLASDYFCNGSYFSGGPRTINIPAIPPPPPLQNKVYVALILSDGDNIQYMQHVMKIDWDGGSRGEVPISWTASALAADLDPVMFNYYSSTVTSNDCLISGPCGPGYAHLELWNSAHLTTLATTADAYLQHTGMRVITVWDSVNSGIARAYATNCPTLLGLTDQNGTYNAVDLGLRTIGLTPTYASLTNQVISAINSAAASWNGTAPLFLAAQAVVWDLGPADLANITRYFNTNEFQFVRADHLYMLANRVYGAPTAVTHGATAITTNTATLSGTVNAQATNLTAWIEWGTNTSYGSRTAVTNPASQGNLVGRVSSSISGLVPQQIYHYQLVASNYFGTTLGGDKQFTTGGHVIVWGSGALGETNVPAGLTNIVGISAGDYHALAVNNIGTVAAWGSDSLGQTNVPPGLTNVVSVAAGIQHSVALLGNGTVVAWGDNSFGQTNVPAGLTNVTAIAAGGYHSLALQANGMVTAWGYNNLGQTNVPASLTNAVAVAGGFYHSVALKADGTVSAWGYGVFGQTNVPNGLAHVTAVTAGAYHSAALKAVGDAPANLFPVSHWVADSLGGSNGTPVSVWTDMVARNNATQTTSASQPLLYTNVLNGHNVVRFSGSSEYLTVAAANSAIASATDFTLAVVFRTSTPGLTSTSFFDNTGLLGAEQSGIVADWALDINGSELGAGLGAGVGCDADESLYGGNVTDGNPHIALYLRTGGILRLYVDGVIVAEQPDLCLSARGNYPFQIGAMTTTSGYFSGDIAEIQIYNRALSPMEAAGVNEVLATTYGLSSVAGAPACRWVADSLSGANGSAVSNWTDVIAGESATQTAASHRPALENNIINGHKTVRFASASSDYLTVPAAESPLSSAGSFTLIVVFKTSTAGSSSSSFFENTGLLGAEQPGVVDDWALCLNGSELGAGLGSGASGCGADFSLYGGNVTDGTPHVAMYARSGDTITLYVDGAIVAMQDALCTQARGNYPFQIGAMTTTSYFFNGDIAEIQLYGRALNSLEVSSVNETLAATYGLTGAAGSVVVWGSNTSGQANVPNNLTNVWTISSGTEASYNLALSANGTVQGWGGNTFGQTNVPAALTNVATIAAGTGFAMAIGNEPPVATNAAVFGYENHDLVITLPASSPDGSQLNFQILTLPVGALYQYSAGVPGPAITVANTPVTDPLGRVIFVPATGQAGSPYPTFTFIANDGIYNSSAAAVTIDIALPTVPQFSGGTWNPGVPGASSFTLNFSGTAAASYSVLASTDLVNWVDLGAATEASPGQYEYTDQSVTNSPQRFYQLTAP